MTSNTLNFEQWQSIADKALIVKNNIDTKSSVFNELANYSLRLKLSEKTAFNDQLNAAISKEGKYHSIRNAVSVAKKIYDYIILNKLTVIEIHNKRTQSSIEFKVSDIMKSETPLFALSSLYSQIKAESKPQETLNIREVIALALEKENSGLTVPEVMEMPEDMINDYVKAGLAIQEEQKTKEKAFIEYDKLVNAYENLLNSNPELANQFVMSITDRLNKAA